MAFRMFIISSMYKGHLDSFYSENREVLKLSYDEHLKFLLNETTEFVGSYWRGFSRLGMETDCFIANDDLLNNKRKTEKLYRGGSQSDDLLEQIKQFRPEILWIENLSVVTPDWIDKARSTVRSIRLIAGYHCAPFGSSIMNVLKKADLLITCTPGIKMEMESMGIKTYLVYHGFDDNFLSRLSPVKAHGSETDGLIFSGSLISGGDFHGERISLIEQILAENIRIGLYVNVEKPGRIKAKQTLYQINRLLNKIGISKPEEVFEFLNYGKVKVNSYSKRLISSIRQPVYGLEMYNLLASSRVVLNHHIGIAREYAGNMRLFEATGVGCCLLTDHKKNINDLFDPDNEIVVYRNNKDCIEKIKWLLSDETERKRIAINGQKRALKDHKVSDRCSSIIEILSENLKNN